MHPSGPALATLARLALCCAAYLPVGQRLSGVRLSWGMHAKGSGGWHIALCVRGGGGTYESLLLLRRALLA